MKVQLNQVPAFYQRDRVGEVYRVPYQQRATEAVAWEKEHNIQPAAADRQKVGLLLIDVQNTFCIPGFELYVGGASGMDAVEDNRRLCEFIYGNLDSITEIIPTMDSHTAMQIFHPIFWVNEQGEHPAPATMISLQDVEQGKWQVNQDLLDLKGQASHLADYALHYVRQLSSKRQYPLTIWSYHAMLGGIGHALVSAVEEAVFFHSIARKSKTNFELKGSNPLTENYSVLSPEVLDLPDGKAIATKNQSLINKLLNYDALYIAGQAKSHCVAWTVDNLLTEIQSIDPSLANKIYLLTDCMSPVVIPGIVDFTAQAERMFEKFAAAGMNLIQSKDNNVGAY